MVFKMVINGEYKYGYIPSKWGYNVGSKSALPCDDFLLSTKTSSNTFTPGIMVNPRIEVLLDSNTLEETYLTKEVYLKVSGIYKVRLNPIDLDRLVYNYNGYINNQLLGKYALGWCHQPFLLPIDTSIYNLLANRKLKKYTDYKLRHVYRTLLGTEGYLYCGQYSYWLFRYTNRKDCLSGIPYINESIFLISDVLLEVIFNSNSSSKILSKNSFGTKFNQILGSTNHKLVEELGEIIDFNIDEAIYHHCNNSFKAYLNTRNLNHLSISTFTKGELSVPSCLETLCPRIGSKSNEVLFKIIH